LLLLNLFYIEPSELAACNKEYPQIIKLLGFILRVLTEWGVDEKDIVSRFDRSLDE